MSEYCTKEAEISVLTEKMSRIEKLMDGNGKPGINTQMILMNDHLEAREKTDKDIAMALRGLLKFKTEVQTTEKNKEKRQLFTMGVAGLMFTGLGYLISLFF